MMMKNKKVRAAVPGLDFASDHLKELKKGL